MFDEEVGLPEKILFVQGKNKASWKISIVLMNRYFLLKNYYKRCSWKKITNIQENCLVGCFFRETMHLLLLVRNSVLKIHKDPRMY